MDGRDIGTVVLPDAELKIFLTASANVRAKRRYDELCQKGQMVDFDTVLQDIIERDKLRYRNFDRTPTVECLFRNHLCIQICYIEQISHRHVRVKCGLMFIERQLAVDDERYIILHANKYRPLQGVDFQRLRISVVRSV